MSNFRRNIPKKVLRMSEVFVSTQMRFKTGRSASPPAISQSDGHRCGIQSTLSRVAYLWHSGVRLFGAMETAL